MSYSSIIEGLNTYRNDEMFFESIRESSNTELVADDSIYVFEEDEIDEAKVVTFDGKTFPKFGYAVVMCGGSGVGKGFARGTKIAIDAKVFDVDRLKELYIFAQKKGKFKSDVKKYDLANPDDVSALHQKIKSLGVKDKQEEALFKNVENGIMPNVIYDITGDDPDKLERLGAKLKGMGYHVTLVWVITNRQIAMIQNLSRDRVVSQEIFHKIHNDVNKTVFPFLKTMAGNYDAAWLVFNQQVPAKTLSSKEYAQLQDIGAVKLEKKGKEFEIPKEIEMMVYNILGPNEEDPLHPTTYKDFGDVAPGIDLKDKEGKGKKDEIERLKGGLDSLLKKVDTVKNIKK